jgi:hypothetical protein
MKSFISEPTVTRPTILSEKYSLLLVAAVMGLASPAMAAYFLAGSFNGWNPVSHPLMQISSSVWMMTVSGQPGQMYEFKVTDGTWGWTYPEQNSWCQADAEGKFTVIFRTNTFWDGWWPQQYRLELSTAPGSWTVAGTFNGWNNADPATRMIPLGLGVYKLSLTLPPGFHTLKTVVTGDWSSQFGKQGRSTHVESFIVEVTPGYETVDIFLNEIAGTMLVTAGKPQCGDANHPYPSGDLNGDCRVNLADLAIIASNWMVCTGPECAESSDIQVGL